ncbi:MAG: hypothetical protein MN733_21610, partial [Nitrososphaera sp.]|nr:hypothetical protein [Nitrososphaera sp.]
PLFLIWYADLDRDSSTTRGDTPGHGEISNELIKGMTKEILSLQSVTNRMNDLQNTYNAQRPILDHLNLVYRSIVLAVAVALAVGFAGFSWEFGRSVWETYFPTSTKIESNQEDTMKPSDRPESESHKESDTESSDKP